MSAALLSIWKAETIPAPRERAEGVRYVQVTDADRDRIIAEVLVNHPRVRARDILGPSTMRFVSIPRQEVMWRLRMICWKDGSPKHSFPEIGRAIGGRDHTTALHGFRKHEKRMAAR